jgi:hypothetical protein
MRQGRLNELIRQASAEPGGGGDAAMDAAVAGVGGRHEAPAGGGAKGVARLSLNREASGGSDGGGGGYAKAPARLAVRRDTSGGSTLPSPRAAATAPEAPQPTTPRQSSMRTTTSDGDDGRWDVRVGSTAVGTCIQHTSAQDSLRYSFCTLYLCRDSHLHLCRGASSPQYIRPPAAALRSPRNTDLTGPFQPKWLPDASGQPDVQQPDASAASQLKSQQQLPIPPPQPQMQQEQQQQPAPPPPPPPLPEQQPPQVYHKSTRLLSSAKAAGANTYAGIVFL